MTIRPETPEQLADTLRGLSNERRTIRLGGNFSKDRLGGPLKSADAEVSISAMNRLLLYEPHDLTISVQAGMTFLELESTLAKNGQMLPLDPPIGWSAESTIGGVIAANLSGPRRRLFGTARDMVIGMTFATLEGKLIKSGGMVVKNVAGLDMGKLMIGSFGTLAAIASVNFKVVPIPAASRSFVMEFATAAEAFAERDRILASVLQPAALDIVNWPSGYRLLLRAGGNLAVLDRYQRELPKAKMLTGDEETELWRQVHEFTARFLAGNPEGAVVPIASTHTEMEKLVSSLQVPVIARAGSGMTYAHYASQVPSVALAGDFDTMRKLKTLFDPQGLLNPGRLYGHI